jgi:hypothetical protein
VRGKVRGSVSETCDNEDEMNWIWVVCGMRDRVKIGSEDM